MDVNIGLLESRRQQEASHRHCELQTLTCVCVCRKIIELEEELKIVGNNMKSLEIAEQEVRHTLITSHQRY